ncbi:MAG TPA: DinB family protein [Herpetosiphonaceae bacterium]|nr:DinB family protein [Herpetosiphonaceae bacterium]
MTQTHQGLQDRLVAELLDVLEETFERVQGIYLDRGTSLFETLADVSAATASRPVAATCASLAAQVAHVTFYLDVLERALLGQEVGRQDWGEIWRTVTAVSAEEWDASRERLKTTYQRVKASIVATERWDGENAIGASLAIIVHTAYHLGEIRQGLGVLRDAEMPG